MAKIVKFFKISTFFLQVKLKMSEVLCFDIFLRKINFFHENS